MRLWLVLTVPTTTMSNSLRLIVTPNLMTIVPLAERNLPMKTKPIRGVKRTILHSRPSKNMLSPQQQPDPGPSPGPFHAFRHPPIHHHPHPSQAPDQSPADSPPSAKSHDQPPPNLPLRPCETRSPPSSTLPPPPPSTPLLTPAPIPLPRPLKPPDLPSACPT